MELFCSISIVGRIHEDATQLSELFELLYHYSGLDIYQDLSDVIDPVERLQRALGHAEERYQNTPEAERGVPPATAIRKLVETIVVAITHIITSIDYYFYESFPSLEPYIPLSPALELITETSKTVGARIGGRFEQSLPRYRKALAILDRPDRAGLEETYHKYISMGLMRGIGFMDAIIGRPSALDWASKIEEDPWYRTNAWFIRLVYYLYQGSLTRVEQCKQQLELLQLRNPPAQWNEGTSAPFLLIAHGLMDNLNGVSQLIDDIEEFATRFNRWVPISRFAKAEYQRIRGNYQQALEELRGALMLSEPGKQFCWVNIAGALLHTLIAIGKYDEAVAQGRLLHASTENQELGFSISLRLMPLALAEAHCSNWERAAELSSIALDNFTEVGASGLNLGLAFETKARIAILRKDHQQFKAYAQLCHAQYSKGDGNVLFKKYENLISEAQLNGINVPFELLEEDGILKKNEKVNTERVAAILVKPAKFRERIRYALDMLVQNTNSKGGFLYLMQNEELALSATHGDYKSSSELHNWVKSYFSAQLDDVDATRSITVNDSTDISQSEPIQIPIEGDEYRYPLLLRHLTAKGYAITGLAVLIFENGEQPQIPPGLNMALSKFLDDFGDVSVIYPV